MIKFLEEVESIKILWHIEIYDKKQRQKHKQHRTLQWAKGKKKTIIYI